MDDDLVQRLRRRAATYASPPRQGTSATQTARYLRQVQHETASLLETTEDPQALDNAGPAYLRSRAAHYRELAAQQSDPKRAQLFQDLAASFEKHAFTKERSPAPRKA